MMSEKRFTMKYSFEDEEYVFFDGDVALTPSETVKLLNEQQATITELNKQIEQLNLAIDDLLTHTSCDEIKKENRQLKKQVKKLKIENEALQDSNMLLQKICFIDWKK